MFSCCGKKLEDLHDQLEFKLSETKKGIQVEITPKDASKTESFKAIVKGLHDFCGCC